MEILIIICSSLLCTFYLIFKAYYDHRTGKNRFHKCTSKLTENLINFKNSTHFYDRLKLPHIYHVHAISDGFRIKDLAEDIGILFGGYDIIESESDLYKSDKYVYLINYNLIGQNYPDGVYITYKSYDYSPDHIIHLSQDPVKFVKWIYQTSNKTAKKIVKNHCLKNVDLEEITRKLQYYPTVKSTFY